MEEPIYKLNPRQFLEQSLIVPVIDVRAPKEFLQGHIPGAFNLPIFNDEERAAVGINYTQKSRDAALLKGLEIVGPKLKYFVQKANELTNTGEILVHCWRGGMRSEAMAWLFRFAGIRTSVLEGGYKAYRHYIRDSFLQGPPMIVIGGMTGSGKTEILKHLKNLDGQLLDLEGLAHHKGSAFGALGQAEQPSTEQFENDLAKEWLSFDSSKLVWLEDESRNIGKVIIPEGLFLRMMDARLVLVDVPFDQRVMRLAEEYGNFKQSELMTLVRKISKRMGGDRANAAILELEQGNLSDAVARVLTYYDKAYLYGLSKREKSKIVRINMDGTDIQAIAEEIVTMF
jgi:tRNA 2-selenouridine synthase